MGSLPVPTAGEEPWPEHVPARAMTSSFTNLFLYFLSLMPIKAEAHWSASLATIIHWIQEHQSLRHISLEKQHSLARCLGRRRLERPVLRLVCSAGRSCASVVSWSCLEILGVCSHRAHGRAEFIGRLRKWQVAFVVVVAALQSHHRDLSYS